MERFKSRAEISVDVHFDEEGFSWLASEATSEDQDAGAVVTKGKIVGKGRVPLRKIPTRDLGVPGVNGDVLAAGSLPALMREAKDRRKMDLLSWAVLRRYAVARHVFPNPPRSVRKLAYEAIKRAWTRTKMERSLRYPPPGFWSEDVPPSDGSVWPTTEQVDLRLDNRILRFWMGQPLDDLLCPHS